MRSNNHFAQLDGYQSSTEILAAIEQVAGEEFPETAYGDTEAEDLAESRSVCHRIWQEPTDEETADVERIAWTLADADEDVLHWGSTKIRRP